MSLEQLVRASLGLLAAGTLGAATAAEIAVTMNEVTESGVGGSLGTIIFRDTGDTGLLIIPSLQGLGPGVHGFHVHEHGDCGPKTKDGKTVPGGAAGGHYDPENTGRHAGPVGHGHLGDMPVLVVGPDGTASMAMFAPRLQVSDLVGRAVVIHENGDNYSDEPKPLGGGGARVACGVVEAADR